MRTIKVGYRIRFINWDPKDYAIVREITGSMKENDLRLQYDIIHADGSVFKHFGYSPLRAEYNTMEIKINNVFPQRRKA